jgi:hypothetical protein
MMKKRDWDLLFSEYDLRHVLESQLASINDRVLKLETRRFEKDTDDLLAALVASDLVVAPLRLVEDDISVALADAKVDVRHDFDRAIFDRSEPTYVDGIVVTYSVPFIGDKQLWRCRPGRFTFNPPRAVIRDRELEFPYERPDREVAATKALLLADIAKIKEWLPWLDHEIVAYNSALEAKVRQRIVERRRDLRKSADDLASLGFRVGPKTQDTQEPPKPIAAPKSTAAREATRKKARRSYDVALSFAGEDREYVEQVAAQLKSLDVTVFYDGFEQVNLWGKDLAEHLGEVYSKDSRFVVIFASRFYAAKAWPNHEKQFALSRHLRGDKGRILPVRFDETEIPGIPPTLGYLDLRALAPIKLAELIRQKVDADTGEL